METGRGGEGAWKFWVENPEIANNGGEWEMGIAQSECLMKIGLKCKGRIPTVILQKGIPMTSFEER